MPPKRKHRPYENKAAIVEHLGFDSDASFDKWRQSDLVKPHWAHFQKQFLENTNIFTPGKKVAEFVHIYTRIISGEKNGAMTFSSHINRQYTTDLDWHAWLLYWLVDHNTKSRDGCFYGSGVEKIETYRTIWHFIAFEKRQRARAPNKSAKPSAAGSSKNPDQDSSSDEDVDLDPTQGTASVLWSAGMPTELEEEGTHVQIIIKSFFGHTEAGFKSAVEKAFGLHGHRQRITELGPKGGLTFRGAQLQAHRAQKRATFMLETTEVLDEDEAEEEQPLPASDVPALPEREADAETREMHWMEMVSEASDKHANKFDMKVRLWNYNLMKAESKSLRDIPVKHITLNMGERGQEGRHAEQAIRYTHQLNELSRLLSDSNGSDPDGHEESDRPEDDPDMPAGPPLSEITDITAEQIAQYREQNLWLDNVAYQPQDHEEACRNMGIANPAVPRVEGLRGTRTFKFYQPVAIHALMRFEDSPVQGGILGEEMGLGKTMEMIGLLLVRSNERRELIRQGVDVPRALPTLILMPKILINQWKDEILAWTDRFTVVVYYGVPKKQKTEGNVIHQKDRLTRDSSYFNGDEKNSDIIIISSYTTYGGRHGPKVQWNHLAHQRMAEHSCTFKQADTMLITEGYQYEGIYGECPNQLSNLFTRVILDEGHELRNLSKEFGTAVIHTNATYRHIMTGTPTVNGLSDFANLMYFLQNVRLHRGHHLQSLGFPEVGDDDGTESLEKLLESFDPWTVPETDPRAILKFSQEALNAWVFPKKRKGGITSTEQGARIINVFKGLMVRRSYASTLNGRRLNQDLPSVQRMVFECEYTDVERQHYDAAYADSSSVLFRKSKDDSAVTWSTTTYRKLCLLTSWLGFAHLLDYKVKKLKEFRKKKGDARQILRDLRANQIRKGLPGDLRVTVPKASETQEILQRHCVGSPKLRKLLSILAEIVVLRKEKVMIWMNTPAQMEWLYCVLKLCGIDARQLRPDLSAKELSELMADFTTKRENEPPIVLLCSYMVGSNGLNMQYNCRTMIEFEPPPNESIRQQSLARIKRTGNPSTWVRHISLLTTNSFNTQQDAVSMLKSLPFLLTQLNLEIWGKGNNSNGDGNEDEDDDDDETDEEDSGTVLGDYVLHEHELYSVMDPHVAELGLEVLDPDTLLLHIQQKLLGRKLTGDAKSLNDYIKEMKKKPHALDATERLWY